MLNFLICLIISILLSFGMSILLVEKGKDWPIRPWRIKLQLLLRKIHYKIPSVLKCTTCSSFYLSFISDLTVGCIAILTGNFYFFWPFSGMICAGLMWYSIEHLNAIDKEQNINVFISDKENENEN